MKLHQYRPLSGILKQEQTCACPFLWLYQCCEQICLYLGRQAVHVMKLLSEEAQAHEERMPR